MTDQDSHYDLVSALVLCRQLEDIYCLVIKSENFDFILLTKVYLLISEQVNFVERLYRERYGLRNDVFDECADFQDIPNLIAQLLTTQSFRKRFIFVIKILNLLAEELFAVISIDSIVLQGEDCFA